jgi:LysM repeat protein
MMRAIQTGLPAAGICAVLAASPASSQTLLGSIASVDRQHAVAVQHDYTFLERGADVRRFVQLGLLVRVRGNVHFELARVSHPYARPAVRTFIERLAAQYHAACGEPLVVTSLTRPEVRQPRNASDLSVHPAGMAVDLRYSRNARCRRWLEKTLLSLEERDVLEATRERYPAHYHIAVFPTQYRAYVDRLNQRATVRLAAADASEVSSTERYRVNRGDTLWSIARRHGTTVQALKELNGLASSRIRPGQRLMLPGDD